MKDYYEILNIKFTSNQDEIKKSYRKLALLYHPDKNNSTNAKEVFIKITEAYEILSNNLKRKEYDYFYEKFIKKESLTIYEKPLFNEKQSDWSVYGREKANEYSQMNINQFLKEIFNDIVFHGGYFARIGCITYIFIFTGLANLCLLPYMANKGVLDGENGALGGFIMVIVCLGFIFYGIHKLKEEVSEYKGNTKKRKK